MTTTFWARHEKKIMIFVRCCLGLLFIYSSLGKIIHPDAFARSVANYQLLPEFLVNIFAVILPWIEAICGLLLLSGQWVRSASILVAFLLVVFMAAVGISLSRGLDISCGCFDTDGSRKIGLQLLVEDTFFLALAGLLAFKARDGIGRQAFWGLERVRDQPPSP